jgi:phosphatidylinositol alpha-mannosyltransferase
LPDIRLEIIGDNNNDYANHLVMDFNNYKKNIIWKGSLKDRETIAKELMSAYMIVLPSRWEGFPLTLMESLASGRPVIVSDIPAFKSIIKNEALFFRSENIEDLKQKINKLLSNKKYAAFLGKRGKNLAKDYDWDIIAEKTKKIYDLLQL